MRDFTLFIIVMALILPVSVASAIGSLSISDYEGYIDQEITIVISMTTSSSVDSFGFTLNFPTTLLEFDDFDEGTLTNGFDSLGCTQVGNYLLVNGSSQTAIPINSTGTVIEINFTVRDSLYPPQTGTLETYGHSGDILYYSKGTGDFDLVPRIIEVPGDAATIQAGINLANDKDTVRLVNTGTMNAYTGTGNKDIRFYGKEITLEGHSSGLSVIDLAAVIDRRFIHFQDSETNDSIVKNMIIKNGDMGTSDGGAILITNGCSPTIEDLVIEYCEAQDGGAIMIEDSAEPKISYCTIKYCDANWTTGYGGAIAIVNDGTTTTPLISHCKIYGNSARYGGGISINNGNYSGRFELCDSLFYDNEADADGGALYVNTDGDPWITNCAFIDNTANRGAATFFNYVDTDTYVYCSTFACNTSGSNNGAITTLSTGNTAVQFGLCSIHANTPKNFVLANGSLLLYCITDDWNSNNATKTSCQLKSSWGWVYENTTDLCSYVTGINDLDDALYLKQMWNSHVNYTAAGLASSYYWNDSNGTAYLSERNTSENSGYCDSGNADIGFHYSDTCQ